MCQPAKFERASPFLRALTEFFPVPRPCYDATEERAVLVKQMSPEELAEAKQQVRDWRPLAER